MPSASDAPERWPTGSSSWRRVVQGALAVARADHAAGIVAADPGRLAAAVDAFERIGSPLLAAEAALDLADVDGRGVATTTPPTPPSSGRANCAIASTRAVVTPRLSRTR